MCLGRYPSHPLHAGVGGREEERKEGGRERVRKGKEGKRERGREGVSE